ncbi:unnamed protein product [Darwinula stevensoni]|uniref:Uncharacterized protein n=1 Tax=Darwinula stevensoni TaxID=69355 RepID=A0A7R8XDR7_9CRUS|nr:unnamed protein product [Darwinula stevensoni]CAG0893532.1 unnamed protein product [Darwinula stevensoni]
MTSAKGLIEYFRSNPTAQTIRIESRTRVEYPEITICPGVTWNFTALKLTNVTGVSAYNAIWSDLFQEKFNIGVLEALYLYSLTDLSKIVVLCTFPINPQNYEYYRCSPRGGYTWINGSRVYETEDSIDESGDFGEPYYEIRIDSPDEPFTAVRNVTSSGKTFFLLGERSYMLSLSLKYYEFLPSGSKCNGDEEYDYKKVILAQPYQLFRPLSFLEKFTKYTRIVNRQCLEAALLEFMNGAPCINPFVLPIQHEQASMMRLCNTSQDYREFINFHDDVHENFDPGCPRKCKRITYNAIQLDDPDIPPPHHGMIKLNTPTAEVEIVEEHELTSLEQFLSNIGGMVALYLGISFIGLYECLEIFAVWVMSRFVKAQFPPVHV